MVQKAYTETYITSSIECTQSICKNTWIERCYFSKVYAQYDYTIVLTLQLSPNLNKKNIQPDDTLQRLTGRHFPGIKKQIKSGQKTQDQ